MKISEISKILKAQIVCGIKEEEGTVEYAFASDLMSDVLTLDTSNLLLITGLANVQTIRTAEMSNISYIVFCRGKKLSEEIIELAEENQMILMECSYSVFKTCGLLYQSGLKAIY
ncbi:MAG TPA: DRTGG domain-containing protein [Bacteroidales bacterium]|jgi:predicted transcriptional regulator|nr:DRTGG domain-containing protein [Bacteroidales bacterium]HPT04085.1 DRTGG domain-containing protein [Bacteroidales bacterium]